MIRPEGPEQRGVLRSGGTGPGKHARRQPAPDLLPYIDCYWMVRWDLRGRPPELAETLPHPCVYWVTEWGDSAIHGVSSARFTRVLEGRGRVFGVRFRPGGFYPFYRQPISGLTDRSASLAEVFGKTGGSLRRALAALDATATHAVPPGEDSADDEADERMMNLTDRFLLDRLPPPEPRLEQVTRIVGTIAATPGITRVEAVAERFGTSVRALQRMFSLFVGVSPKWVIKRYRLHEAIQRMDAGQVVPWSRLAIELGYFDQTHFIKDFKALIGRSPGEYVKGVR
jgi:AraC-like DNA-binding protein